MSDWRVPVGREYIPCPGLSRKRTRPNRCPGLCRRFGIRTRAGIHDAVAGLQRPITPREKAALSVSIYFDSNGKNSGARMETPAIVAV